MPSADSAAAAAAAAAATRQPAAAGFGGGEAIFGEGPAVPTVLDADATAEGFESLAAASRDAWSAWAGADVDVWA